MKALCSALSTWSSRVAADKQPADELFEEETDPRLRAMFEDRKTAALVAIEGALGQGWVSEDEKADIVALLHQIAGVAAYFGGGELGDFCRTSQHDLNAAREGAHTIALLETIRERLRPAPAKG